MNSSIRFHRRCSITTASAVAGLLCATIVLLSAEPANATNPPCVPDFHQPCDVVPYAVTNAVNQAGNTADQSGVVTDPNQNASDVLDYASASTDPTDPTTYALPQTPLDDTLGSLGLEDQPGGVFVGVDGGVSTDSVYVYLLPKAQATAVQDGVLPLATAIRTDSVGGAYALTCGLSFRRRITEHRGFRYDVSWGSRVSCTGSLKYASYRARLVPYRQDSTVLSYANQVAYGPYKNDFSGGSTEFLHDPHLVVYLTASLTFPTPSDPNNYVFGVAADPRTVDQYHSDCDVVGKTYTVSCDARSLAFTK